MGASRAPRATQAELAERVDAAEEMLLAPLASLIVRKQLIERYGVSERQAKQYISEVYKRWRQNRTEHPARRELNYRRGERMLGKAVAAKSYSAAAAIYTAMTKQSAASSAPETRLRKKLMARLGAVPDDPSEALGYARQILLIEMAEVATNPDLDPKERRRWLSEFAGKLGMLYSRAEAEELLKELEALVRGKLTQPAAAKVVDAKSVGFAEAAGPQEHHLGPRAVPGPGADDGEGGAPDGDDPPRRR